MTNTNPNNFSQLTDEQRQAVDDIFAEKAKQFIPNQTQELPQVEPSKHWSQSKTMWFNAGVTALGVASTVLPFAKPFIKPRHYGILTTAIGVGNMLLRSVTKEKITK
ncbi:MAG: hypothetical protein KGV51_08335 [Moraxellaceae bacterium]|nr:hypothetical protein [Moraxellaceae bacterium]